MDSCHPRAKMYQHNVYVNSMFSSAGRKEHILAGTSKNCQESKDGLNNWITNTFLYIVLSVNFLLAIVQPSALVQPSPALSLHFATIRFPRQSDISASLLLSLCLYS